VGLKNQFSREKFVLSRQMLVIIMRTRGFCYLPTKLQFLACDAVQIGNNFLPRHWYLYMKLLGATKSVWYIAVYETTEPYYAV